MIFPSYTFSVFFSLYRALRNSKTIADLLDKRDYMKYNPTISLRVDQKATLICNVNPSQKVLKHSFPLFLYNLLSPFYIFFCHDC